MRRYIYFLVIALLAFGIGVFAGSVSFYQKTEVKPFISQTIYETKIEKTELPKPLAIEKTEIPKQKTDFKCTDKVLSPVWKHIKTGDSADLEDAALADGKENCSDIIFVLEKVDLNGDGVKEVIVGGKHWLVNGATGNFGIWICQKYGNRYKVIFSDSAEEHIIKKSKTNGYRDIFLKFHASCCSSYQTTYKFQKGKYRENRCSFVDYGTTGIKSVRTCAEENARFEKETRQDAINLKN